MVLQFTSTVPKHPSVCVNSMAHEKQTPAACPAQCAASRDQRGAAWPEGELSPTESGRGAVEQMHQCEQQCSLQACAAGT